MGKGRQAPQKWPPMGGLRGQTAGGMRGLGRRGQPGLGGGWLILQAPPSCCLTEASHLKLHYQQPLGDGVFLSSFSVPRHPQPQRRLSSVLWCLWDWCLDRRIIGSEIPRVQEGRSPLWRSSLPLLEGVGFCVGLWEAGFYALSLLPQLLVGCFTCADFFQLGCAACVILPLYRSNLMVSAWNTVS